MNVFRRTRTRARAKEKNSKKERNATKKKRIQAARLSSEDEKQTNEYERCATAKENSFEIKKKETDVTHRLRQQQQQRRRHDVGPRITNSANGDENDSSKKRKKQKEPSDERKKRFAERRVVEAEIVWVLFYFIGLRCRAYFFGFPSVVA